MTRSSITGVKVWPGPRSILRAALTALALLVVGVAAHAAEEKPHVLAKEDKACLECHAKPDLDKTLRNGETLSLHIAPQAFVDSVHNSSGCDGCHNEIDMDDHGKDSPQDIASKRAHALSMQQTCRDCHKKTVKEYDDSVHAVLVREGSADAPLCTDCHNPHATRSSKNEDHAGPSPCATCHEDVVKAYTASVHGQAGDEALTCADCHRTHAVKAVALKDHLKGECLSCHRDAVKLHATWLPNTERHLDAVACSACHSPDAKRRVDLLLYDGKSPQTAEENVGVPQFVKLTQVSDTTGTALDARAFWSLLKDFNRHDGDARAVVHGRLEVQSGAEAHRLAKKDKAIKDCDTCHRQGAEAFQSVTVTMASADGLALRRDATQGLLSSVESIGSVGGFYAIGGTRIHLLDTLLVMALAAGVLIPAAHMSVKLLSKRAHARQAAAASQAEEGASEDHDAQ